MKVKVKAKKQVQAFALASTFAFSLHGPRHYMYIWSYKNLFLNFLFELPWFASVKDWYLTPLLFILRKQKSKHMSLLDFLVAVWDVWDIEVPKEREWLKNLTNVYRYLPTPSKIIFRHLRIFSVYHLTSLTMRTLCLVTRNNFKGNLS